MSKVGVKFVDGGKIFCVNSSLDLNIGDRVVVDSVRGLELATVCKGVKEECQDEIKSIIRLATREDIAKAEELRAGAPRIIKITNDLIHKYKLDMKLVDISFTLDGTKVVINYVCEERVDFRDLVKELAGQLKLRIELRQIGIRDQAKILGGIGFCGKECCCKKYLNDFDKVSIKMAKTQGLSLNPTKISGICGRLMCCLSYENEFYSEISSKMPKLNSRVRTKDGVGSVIYNNLLKQKVTVKVENENDIKINEYEVSDIEVLPKNNTPMPQKKDTFEKKSESKKQDLVSAKDDRSMSKYQDKNSSEKTQEKEQNVEKNNCGEKTNNERRDKKKFKKFKHKEHRG